MLNGDGNEEFVAGDSVCNTCLGITFYDMFMKKEKSPFICYGIRGTSEEITAAVVEEGVKEYPADFESYACLGKAISTGRMERRGIAPIRMFGMESVSRKESKGNRNDQRNKMLRERQSTLDAQNAKKSSE